MTKKKKYSIEGLISELATVWDIRLDVEPDWEETIYDTSETNTPE